MQSIFKYPIQITDTQVIQVPEGAKILSAQMQEGTLCIWALVDTEKPQSQAVIAIYGTGNPIQGEVGRFIDTVKMGRFAWHVFEL